MKIFKNKLVLQKEISKDNCISFVPTMGGLHSGHLSLIKKAKLYKCKILVSIFVNSKQFSKKDDFKNYPRNLKNDIKKLKKLKVNYLYLPAYKDIYDFKPKNKIFIDNFSKKLCGKFRKAHFKGVLNVVNRFLEIVKPRFIYLGLKDFQQLTLINLHILKRKINTKVIKCKTVRDINGVACSTRNFNLNKKQLKIASKVYMYLLKLKKKVKKDLNIFNIKTIKKDLISLGVNKIDYIENINIDKLKKKKKDQGNFNFFIAYYIKKIRLIDNI
ncbi:pantoate--beta-alanine ligase [Pelagibacteraceae bacterium]|nr:pantoate--beta-alanine ligase [Pelagibacteraceae bacterium]